MKRLGRGVAKPELWRREVVKGFARCKVPIGLGFKSAPSFIGRSFNSNEDKRRAAPYNSPATVRFSKIYVIYSSKTPRKNMSEKNNCKVRYW